MWRKEYKRWIQRSQIINSQRVHEVALPTRPHSYSKDGTSCSIRILQKLCSIPHHSKCKVCQFAKQHRSNHKVKGEDKKIFESSYPGQRVSVDQLESSIEGFYGQVKEKLTRNCISMLQFCRSIQPIHIYPSTIVSHKRRNCQSNRDIWNKGHGGRGTNWTLSYQQQY